MKLTQHCKLTIFQLLKKGGKVYEYPLKKKKKKDTAAGIWETGRNLAPEAKTGALRPGRIYKVLQAKFWQN